MGSVSSSVMGLSSRASLLSKRGDEIGKESAKMELWKVFQNLWDPEENPGGIVGLGMAENWLMRDEISKHIKDNFNPPPRALTYGDGTTGTKLLKETTSKFLNDHLKPVKQIEPAHLSMTNGTSSALEHLSWTLADAGDAFLIGRPYYGNYEPAYTWRFGAKLETVSFDKDDDRFDEVAVEKYETALKNAKYKGLKIAGLILCNPHNPLGRCYPRKVLIGLMKLCQAYGIHLICDEIFALSTWENTVDKEPPPVNFESVLSINPKEIIDGHRIHVIWGMSKDFGANGIRVGALISQYNDALHQSLVAVGLYTSVSSLSDYVTVNLLSDKAWLETYIPENQKRLSESFKKIATWAQTNGIPYAKGTNAGFCIWADLGSKYREKHPDAKEKDVMDLIMKALREHKVFLASGSEFNAENPGWFRIVFSVSDYYIDEGLRRVIKALA